MEIAGKAGVGVALEGTEALCVKIGVSVIVGEILIAVAFVPVMDSIVNVLIMRDAPRVYLRDSKIVAVRGATVVKVTVAGSFPVVFASAMEVGLGTGDWGNHLVDTDFVLLRLARYHLSSRVEDN